MKINYDCIRELLIVLEENLIFSEELEYPHLNFCKVCQLLPDFSKQDIVYSTMMLEQGDYINARIMGGDNRVIECIYTSVTFTGHQLLENIKNDNVWNKTKEVSKSIGSSSIEVITSIANNILTSLISNKLQLPF